MTAFLFVGLFAVLWFGAWASLTGLDNPRKPKGGKRNRVVSVFVSVGNMKGE
jgi:hypothetical protein